MRPLRLSALAIVLFAAPCVAQELDLPDESAPDFTCDQKDLSAELSALCGGISDGFRDAMSRAVDPGFGKRPAPAPSLARRAIVPELTSRGLGPAPIDRRRDPFATPDDRGLGVRLRAAGAPVQFTTELVQPGLGGDTAMNWELKAERMDAQSGLFYGGSTGGVFNPDGASENVSGFVGVRGVTTPFDNLSIGAEIAPHVGISDLSAPQGMVALEPKMTAQSNLGRLGTSDFTGSLNADAGYNIPLEGEPAAWGGVRFTVRPR